jgi:GNAT superfamily N-acetyltransferase
MPDMLVKLYTLPPLEPEIAGQQTKGITIRRAIAPEKHIVTLWVQQHFFNSWVSEVDVAFHRSPPTCWLAAEGQELIGFACYDTSARGFFGPTGVSEAARGRGVGRALLIACLHAMRWEGYGYAIIGWAGPTGFYEKAVGAIPIPDSEPGVYAGVLRDPD